MPTTLFEQFLTTECTEYVRKLIIRGIEDARSGTGPRRPHFEFNRFEVSIDLEKGIVILADEFDASDTGAQSVSVEEFSTALERMHYLR